MSNGKATITGYTGSGGDITIPDTLGGCPVTTIGNYAFSSCASLTDVYYAADAAKWGGSALATTTLI